MKKWKNIENSTKSLFNSQATAKFWSIKSDRCCSQTTVQFYSRLSVLGTHFIVIPDRNNSPALWVNLALVTVVHQQQTKIIICLLDNTKITLEGDRMGAVLDELNRIRDLNDEGDLMPNLNELVEDFP